MPDLSFRDIQKGLRDLGLSRESAVIAHISLPAFGPVRGGVETVVGALTGLCRLVVMPTFTYQCQVVPLAGPPNNAIDYTDHLTDNVEAEIFRLDLPAHPDMGPAAETLRRLPGAVRSSHPLLSFAAVGVEAEKVASAQNLAEPLGPVAALAEMDGDVLLAGVGHTANVALHYAEYRAGRKQFIRWALTTSGVMECVACPGCAVGFDAIANHLMPFNRSAQIGPAHVQCFPLRPLLHVAEELLRADPAALLCHRPDCVLCNAVRAGQTKR